jgi:DNA-binding LacI/PurR family transcriptional regulator
MVRQMLERRLVHGVYVARELPSERELAEDMQVSRMTARKALQQLVERGKLERQENGRIVVARNRGGSFQVTLLVPSMASTEIERFRLALERVARARQATISTRLYLHWEDPIIPESLSAGGGVFLVPSCEPIPPRLVQRFRQDHLRMVSWGFDLSPYGIPSIDLLPPHALHRLLDHLAGLGHRSIDCFNVQTVDPIIEARIQQWKLWLSAHRLQGQLLNSPIPAYSSPLTRAFEEMTEILKRGEFQGSALFCTTVPAAIGAMRAMKNAGIEPGKERSIVAFSDENLGRYMVPSVASLKYPSPDPYLEMCLDWMQGQDSVWIGPLLVREAEHAVVAGESVGAVVLASDRR